MSVAVAVSPRLCDASEAIRSASEFERHKGVRARGGSLAMTRTQLRASEQVPVGWISNFPFPCESRSHNKRAKLTEEEVEACPRTQVSSATAVACTTPAPPRGRNSIAAVPTIITSHPSPAIFQNVLEFLTWTGIRNRLVKISQSSLPSPPRTISVNTQTDIVVK
jgi:hypothetical protein